MHLAQLEALTGFGLDTGSIGDAPQ